MLITVKNLGREWKIDAPEEFWFHYLAILSDSSKLDEKEGLFYAAFVKESEWIDINSQAAQYKLKNKLNDELIGE